MVYSQILRYFFFTQEEKSSRKLDRVDKQQSTIKGLSWSPMEWGSEQGGGQEALVRCNQVLVLGAGGAGLLQEQDRSCVGEL